MVGDRLCGRVRVVLAAACGLTLLLAVAAPSGGAVRSGATYYVSAGGNDANDGGSPGTAWRTLAKAASVPLAPGDSVLFRGGDTFGGTLKTGSAGTAAAPILFGSYGAGAARIVAATGAAAIYLNSNRYLRFQDIDVSAQTAACVLVSGSGAGSTDILLDRLKIHDCGGPGLIAANAADARITLSNSSVTGTQDSGVFFRGASFTIAGNTITNTGINASGALTWPLHGIYAKGPGPTITGNTITDFQSAGITIRFTGSDVERNTIAARTRGTRGISYYQETAVPGTTRILNNAISGVSVQGIAIDNGSTTAGFGGGAATASTSESFVVADNQITMKGDTASYAVEGIRILQVPSATVTGNRVGGTLTRVCNVYGPGVYGESKNAWQTSAGSASFLWSGKAMTFSAYRAASGEGAGDSLF